MLNPSTHWAAAPATVPMPGALYHWDALADVTRDVPGEVVVHVVAGGRATFEFKPAPKEN